MQIITIKDIKKKWDEIYKNKSQQNFNNKSINYDKGYIDAIKDILLDLKKVWDFYEYIENSLFILGLIPMTIGVILGVIITLIAKTI